MAARKRKAAARKTAKVKRGRKAKPAIVLETPVKKRKINSRAKGAGFERHLAVYLRVRFPHLADAIRRANQARQAEESDVTGLPCFWLECQHAQPQKYRPAKKLEQAIRDHVEGTIPVAVTRVNGAALPDGVRVTMRMRDLHMLTEVLADCPPKLPPACKRWSDNFAPNMAVDISLLAFCELIDRVEPWTEKFRDTYMT